MKRILWLVAFGLVAACNRPSDDDCRKALGNMQHLLGTENLGNPSSFEGEVRRCKGASTKEAVACAIKATTLDELKKCEIPEDSDTSDDK